MARLTVYLKQHHWGLIATCIALTGTAYAATSLPANSVGSRQIKKEAVTKAKLRAGLLDELTGAAPGSAGPGSPGQDGPTGPRGPSGPNAVSLRVNDVQSETLTEFGSQPTLQPLAQFGPFTATYTCALFNIQYPIASPVFLTAGIRISGLGGTMQTAAINTIDDSNSDDPGTPYSENFASSGGASLPAEIAAMSPPFSGDHYGRSVGRAEVYTDDALWEVTFHLFVDSRLDRHSCSIWGAAYPVG